MQLVLEGVTKHFGGLRAVSDVSLTVQPKSIFGLIGPNGAGKTTVFNLITRVYKHDAGAIRFGGEDLGRLKPAQIAGVGIGRTFQNIRLFGQLTVLENLLVACELQKTAHLAAAVLRLGAHYADEETMEARALELLRVFDLEAVADASPTSLPYGDQRRLEIARAMMLRPKLLLLDEPAAGMNYGEAEGLKTQIRWLRDTFEVSVVLVEHNMQVVMGVCEEIHVLDHGETIAHGSPREIAANPSVIAAYLGTDTESEEPPLSPVPVPVPDLPPPPPEPPRAPAQSLFHLDTPQAMTVPRRLSELELGDLSKNLLGSIERGLSGSDLRQALGAPWPAADEPTQIRTPIGGIAVSPHPMRPISDSLPDFTDEPSSPGGDEDAPTKVGRSLVQTDVPPEPELEDVDDEVETRVADWDGPIPIPPPDDVALPSALQKRPTIRRIEGAPPTPRSSTKIAAVQPTMPKETPTRPAFSPIALPPSGTERLANVDSGWSSNRQVVAEAVPDANMVDLAWSEQKIPPAPPTAPSAPSSDVLPDESELTSPDFLVPTHDEKDKP